MTRRATLITTTMALTGAFGLFIFTLLFAATAGQDWMVSDTAARQFLQGDISVLLDGAHMTDVLNATHATLRQKLVFHPWVYPPYALLLVLPFGLVPWWASYGGYMVLTLALMAWGLRLWLGGGWRFWLVLAGVLLSPASIYNIGAGQNGYFSAGLLLAGFWLLPRRPVIAGALLGLMAYKPQLCLLLPAALLAARARPAIASATATFAALVAVSCVVPGIPVWQGWLHLYTGTSLAPRTWVELYGQSIFTCLRLAGLPEFWANTGQAAALAGSALAVWRALHGTADSEWRLVILLTAISFSAPHFGDYDAVLLTVAAVLLLTRPQTPAGPWAAALATACWCSTAINPPLLYAKTIPALFYVSELTPLFVLGFLLAVWHETAARGRARPDATLASATA
jgi:hypothetical protein